VPAGERQRLRISLFTCAAQEDIGGCWPSPAPTIVAVTAGAHPPVPPSRPDLETGTGRCTPVVPPGRLQGLMGDSTGLALTAAGDCAAGGSGLQAARSACRRRDGPGTGLRW
jgi:hypothetical protein